VFVGLYNSSDTLIASGSLALDGTLGFVANDIVNGEYRFVVSTNNDDDGYVCDSGELCARYPGSEGAKTFTVNGADTDGAIIDLEPIFRFGGINAASMGGQASYNADIKSPTAGIVSKRITKLEGLDSDDVDDREDGKIPEDAIPINSN